MAEIRRLDTGAEARGYVVALLRDLLALAEDGDLLAAHVCVKFADDRSLQRHSAGEYNTHDVVAALEYMKFDLIACGRDG